MQIEDHVVLKVERFNLNDVSGLIRLSSSVGWDYDEEEIHTILSSVSIFGQKNPERETLQVQSSFLTKRNSLQ
jgi:hypothetical protein